MHHNGPQRTAVVQKHFAMFLQCTAMDRNALQSVCLLVHIQHLGKTVSGIIQWDAVGDGGWGGVCIGVLDFGDDRRKGMGSFWRVKVRDFPL